MKNSLNGVVYEGNIPGTSIGFAVVATTSLTGSVEMGIVLDNRAVCGCKVQHKRDGILLKPFASKAVLLDKSGAVASTVEDDE